MSKGSTKKDEITFTFRLYSCSHVAVPCLCSRCFHVKVGIPVALAARNIIKAKQSSSPVEPTPTTNNQSQQQLLPPLLSTLLPNRIRRTQPLHQMVPRRHHHFPVLRCSPSTRSSACCMLAHDIAGNRLQQDVVERVAEVG
jgi:hypothetical protein